MLTQERLKELLIYDPATGVFRWRASRRGVKAGMVAGRRRKDGYRRIQVDGKVYYGQRLAWLYMTGAWPAHKVDHRDGTPGNDWWENLREATHAQNMRNSKSRKHNTLGVKGVRRTKEGNYSVRITVDRRRIHLGTTHNLALAGYMYAIAAAGYHREFARAA